MQQKQQEEQKYYTIQLEEKVQEQFLESIKNKENLTLRQWGELVLNTQNPDLKAAITLYAQKQWVEGHIKEIGSVITVDQPLRPDNLVAVHPSKMPRRKNNKEGGGIMLHTLTHVENIAIELSWDIAMRYDKEQYKLPKQFFDDWVRIAAEEAKHYDMVKKRMEQFYQKSYGDYPVHQGLWDDALKTKDSLMNRLVLEHCVHEARGLDVTKVQTIPRFSEDPETQKILADHIYPDEITHVREGLTWFRHICKNILGIQEDSDIIAKYHQTVKEVWKAGFLNGPFDKEGRDKAGMSEEYYLPLQKQEKKE